MTSPPNDFDVAKSIHDLLEPLNDEQRIRIIRWVSESLDFKIVEAKKSIPMTPAPHSVDQNPQTPQPTVTPTPENTTDIKSFSESKLPKTDSQFSVVVAYYYQFLAPTDQRSETINADKLQDATRLVGRARFTNALNTLNNTKKAGYLDSPSAGEFEINTVGENLVAMTLPSDTGTKTVKKKASSKKAKKKAAKKAKKKSSKKKK